MRFLNKRGFIDKGFPYFGWLVAIQSAVIKTALKFDLSLLFCGEDGEVEYGGSTETKNIATYDSSYQRRIYLEDGYEKVLNKIGKYFKNLFIYTSLILLLMVIQDEECISNF